MTDITAFTSILGSIKTATDIVKLIKSSDISLEKAETKSKLAGLISALADAKIEVAELQNLISEKDEKIKKLEEVLEIKKKLRYEAPYYWLDDGSKKEGPFCQVCYDNNRKLIRLQEYGQGHWICNVCKNEYIDSKRVFPFLFQATASSDLIFIFFICLAPSILPKTVPPDIFVFYQYVKVFTRAIPPGNITKKCFSWFSSFEKCQKSVFHNISKLKYAEKVFFENV